MRVVGEEREHPTGEPILARAAHRGESALDLVIGERVELTQRARETLGEALEPLPRSVGRAQAAQRTELFVLRFERGGDVGGSEARHPSMLRGSTNRRAGRNVSSMTDAKREIEEAQKEFVRLDGQILAALEKRAKLSRRVAELRSGKPSLPTTERAQIAALVARASGDMPAEDLRIIFGRIYAACLALELPAAVAYVGATGGPGYEAARARFGSGAELFACENVAGALDEVAKGRAELAVIPIETLAEGLVQSTLESMLATELRIVHVIESANDVALVSKTGNESDVEKVYATAHDHAHASRWLAGRKVTVIDVKSQAAACDFAADDHGAAALASETYGIERGLLVARRSVSDSGPERTRYAVVSQRPSGRTGDDSTACVFSVNDAPGVLLGVLKVFADRGVNLKKIQSRPTPSAEWDYLFFVELSGHATDRALVSAFEEVRQKTRFFKVLGSYPSP